MVESQHDILAILTEAVTLESPAQRSRYLDEACGSDAIARHRVETLLKAHFEAGKFLGEYSPDATAMGNSELAERPGTLIGRYKLLEQIGEGGMGIVFVAEQTEPVRRRVALKIIKPGMDTKQVIARFEAERQALAMMDHPNIARVLDAGATETGRPYFVMELVRGMPITEYCDKARLSPRQRLELFVDVCQAVQHAHQKGIIHRDLKPSNVMVTMQDGRPVVKVIDFGVAKAVGQQLTERTVYTALTQLVGTPLYMSPEQAELTSHDVDTRSDVYSLGVLLYELLTGQTPFDKETLAEAGLDEMRRIIREDEPLRPSRRFSTLGAQAISTVSQHRSLDERRLSKILCGELDWIVMKALEKDRSRRYESASALATDIQRYLSDEPVLACPPTTMYRFQKFARKHKPALAAGIAFSPDGERLASAGGRELRVLDAQTGRELLSLKGQMGTVMGVTFSPDGKRLATTNYSVDGARVRVWDAQTGQEPITLMHSNWVAGVAFTPDGQCLASASDELSGGGVKLWDVQSAKELLTLKLASQAVAVSPDGQRLASASSGDNTVIVCNAQTGEALLTLRGHTSPAQSVAYSPDGSRLASASGGLLEQGQPVPGDVRVWDARTGQELLILKGHTSKVSKVVFSPDGKRLASASWDQTVKVWDAQTGRELVNLQGHARGHGDVAFSPDGKRLASAYGKDQTAKVWDAQTGQELLTLKGHTATVRGVAFSPDGKRLASTSADQTLKVWDAQTGQETLTLDGHTTLTGVVFSPNGQRLASHSRGQRVLIWDATPVAEKP